MKRYKTSTGNIAVITESAIDLKFREFDLANGLHCILYKDNLNPIINLSIGYKAGSKDDDINKSGLAHFFEHMMFQGSENVKKNEHFGNVMKSGGVCNAFTMFDGTVYYEVMPSNNLEMALWLESDRMNSLNITEENLINQKNVVTEEKKQVYENAPYGSTNENIFKNVFKGSSYEISIIGKFEDIDSFKVDEALEFHRKFYSPENAVLMISGDIDYENAEKLIKKYFSGINKESNIVRKKNIITEMKDDISIEVRDNVQLTVLNLCYLLPKKGSKEGYIFDYVNEILASGKSSRLYRKLVYEKKLLKSIYCYTLLLEDAGVLIIKAMLNPGTDIIEIEKEIYNEIERLAETGCSNEEFEKVRNLIEFEMAVKYQKLNNISVETIINYLYFKDTERINKDVNYYLSVTKQDIQNCVKKFILDKKKLKLTYLPK